MKQLARGTMRGRAVRTLLGVILALAIVPFAIAADLKQGNILVVETGPHGPGGQVVSIEPTNGEQMILSSDGFLVDPMDIAVTPSGDIYVTNDNLFDDPSGQDAAAVIRIDPVTGVQSIVSEQGLLFSPTGLAISTNGTLFVVDHGWDLQGHAEGRVIQINPTSGAQTRVPGTTTGYCWGDIAVDSNGDLILAIGGCSFGVIVRVDPVTGSLTPITSIGGNYLGPICLDSAGNILATINNPISQGLPPSIFRVDPMTGEQALVSQSGLFGYVPHSFAGIVTATATEIFVSKYTGDWSGGPCTRPVCNGELLRVDAVTGEAALLTTNLHNLGGMAIFPGVPNETPINADIDIKPGSCPNPFKVKSTGVLPVAILGTDDLDVTTIDVQTVRLEGVAPLRWTDDEDVATPFIGDLCECHELSGDDYMDLTLKFDRREVSEALKAWQVLGQMIPVTITGNLKEEYGGTAFSGQDCVLVKPKVKGKAKLEPIDESGVYGKARLVTRKDGTTKVILKRFSGLTPGETYTAHIRSGSCGADNILFSLNDVIVNAEGIGRSVTIVDATIDFDTWWIEVGGLTCGEVKLR